MYSRIFSLAGTPRSASSRSAASSLLASQSRNERDLGGVLGLGRGRPEHRRLVVRGRPSAPSSGVGTLQRHEVLAARVAERCDLVRPPRAERRLVRRGERLGEAAGLALDGRRRVGRAAGLGHLEQELPPRASVLLGRGDLAVGRRRGTRRAGAASCSGRRPRSPTTACRRRCRRWPRRPPRRSSAKSSHVQVSSSGSVDAVLLEQVGVRHDRVGLMPTGTPYCMPSSAPVPSTASGKSSVVSAVPRRAEVEQHAVARRRSTAASRPSG